MISRHPGRLLLCLLLVGCPPTQTYAPVPAPTATAEQPVSLGELLILAWNVESNGNDPAVITAQLSEFSGYDIYCLSEVSPSSFGRYLNAVGMGFSSVESVSGRSDRLQNLVNTDRFEVLQEVELDRHRGYTLNNGTHRSPLFVRLRDRASGVEFIVMTNHLARGNAELRTEQAEGLREWARDQNVPVVNIGDFNMDFDFLSERGNEAFDEMIRDSIWQWVRPETLIDTNWADRDGDGLDNYPNSMLDFAFVVGAAKEWNPVCRVIVRDGDFPDDDSTSDHRPIELRLRPNVVLDEW